MATWCYPCVVEMRDLREIYAKYRTSGVVMISVDIDPTEKPADLQKFRSDYCGDWIYAYDSRQKPSGGYISTLYNLTYIPTNYIIDKNGMITYAKTVLPANQQEMSQTIDHLLGE